MLCIILCGWMKEASMEHNTHVHDPVHARTACMVADGLIMVQLVQLCRLRIQLLIDMSPKFL